MGQIVSLNFGLVHQPPKFDYDFDFDDLDDEIKEQLPEDTAEILQMFSEEDLHFLRWRICWQQMARKKQLPPEEFLSMAKHIWLIRSGRGFGKTLTGANWMGEQAWLIPSFYAVVSPTHDDVRYTCFEGPTGLISVIPPQLIHDRNQALPSITLKNGSIIRGFAGDTPERLRGPQHAAIWADEIASWKYPQEAWDNMLFGLRLGTTPRMCVTGTPKPTPFIRRLLKDKRCVDVVGATYENRENLTDYFFESIAKYEGTRVGRQEIHGEVLDPEEEGFVQRSQWRVWPADKKLPQFTYIVMSIDPAFKERNYDKRKQESDPTACSVWGMFMVPRLGKPPVPNTMLLDAWEDWLGFPALVRRIKKERGYTYGDTEEPLLKPIIVPKHKRAKHQGRRIDIILIEEKASGISIRQQLADENILTHGYNPGNEDKLTRLHYVSPMFAAGRVWAVESEVNPGNFKSWSDPLVSQVCSYVGPGSVERDDLLDTATQGLRLLMDKFFGPFTVVDSVEDRERARAREIAERRLSKKESPYG
jgi:phage terminase large subunit-like protein